jgi:hypothetical protein
MYAYEVDAFEIYEVRCIAGPLVKWRRDARRRTVKNAILRPAIQKLATARFINACFAIGDSRTHLRSIKCVRVRRSKIQNGTVTYGPNLPPYRGALPGSPRLGFTFLDPIVTFLGRDNTHSNWPRVCFDLASIPSMLDRRHAASHWPVIMHHLVSIAKFRTSSSGQPQLRRSYVSPCP